MFEVGSKAAYRSHGIVKICGIESKHVGGQKQNFYILHILNSGVRIMEPVASSHEMMRAIVNKDTVDQVFGTLMRPVEIIKRSWNQRHREYLEKLSTDSIIKVAEVLRDLWWQKQVKAMSLDEKIMYQKAISFLREEISVARDLDSEVAEALIIQCLEKAYLESDDVIEGISS
ncbi:MAG: CarD family transcriptional regulator [Proteobacteria bacterium]|nr:CarD family transcriptional regulator [Pseudomonadota bacterium]